MQQVIYYSMGGNTRKLAEAMAGELDVKAVDVKTATLEPGDGILFLGSGCYGGKPGMDVQKFVEAHDFKGRRVAIFGTSGGGGGLEVKAMEELMRGKGAEVIGSYHCSGKSFLLFSRGHPDAADVEAARKFARAMAGLQQGTQPEVWK